MSVRVRAPLNAQRAPPRSGGDALHNADTLVRGVRVVQRYQPASRRAPMGRDLLEGDGGASLFELGLRLLSGLLVGTLENGAGGTVDESLRLTEAEAGEGAHLLDDLDLLLTGRLEDDVEGVLLLDLFGSGAGATGSRGGDRDGGGGGDLEGLLELLHELAELDEGELLERVEQLVSRQLCHDFLLSVCGYSPLAGPGGLTQRTPASHAARRPCERPATAVR